MIDNTINQPPFPIVVDPEVHFGKPCVAGTRIKVEDVLELVSTGISIQEIIDEYYSDLTEHQVKACIKYAIAIVQNEEIHFDRTAA